MRVRTKEAVALPLLSRASWVLPTTDDRPSLSTVRDLPTTMFPLLAALAVADMVTKLVPVVSIAVEAKKVCVSCDVRGECLEYALEKDERFGIWGGLSERERRKLKRRAV